MKRLNKVIFSLLLAFVLVSSLIIAGLIVCWTHPHLVLNSRTLPWIVARAAGSSTAFVAETIDIQFQKPNFWNRTVTLTLGKACVQRQRVSSCFSGSIESGLRLSFIEGIIIPYVSVMSSHLSLESKDDLLFDPQRSSLNSDSGLIDFPNLLARGLAIFEFRRMETVDLRFDRVEIDGSEWVPAFSFSVRALRSERKATISLQMTGPSRLRAEECFVVWSGTPQQSTIRGQCAWRALWPAHVTALNLFQQPDVTFDSVLDLRFQNGRLSDDSQLEIFLSSWKSRAIDLRARLRPILVDPQTHEIRAVQWEVDAAAQSFQKLRPLFLRLGVEVPAPFHVLEGSLLFGWRGVLRTHLAETPETELFVMIRLASLEQKLVAEGRGRGSFSGVLRGSKIDVRLDLDVVLREVELVAPPLRFQTPPALVPDRRFGRRVTSSSHGSSVSMTYDIRIRTDKPLLIKTDLTLAPVPVGVDLRLRSDHPMTGSVHVHRVGFDLLRRDVELQGLTIKFLPSGRSRPIQGEVRARFVGYVVRILLDGEFSRPRIQLKSEPPLSEDEIHSVLLFGSPLGSLGMEDISSVASFKGAVVARAVTLASLYFLVATPVQSVSFNPQTGAFGAQVRLPRNLALRLGVEDDGARQMGLRKRLNREFYLETEFRHPQADASENRGPALSTYLIWFKRH